MFGKKKKKEEPEEDPGPSRDDKVKAHVTAAVTETVKVDKKNKWDETQKLGINIFKAMQLPNADRFGASDAYVQVTIVGKKLTKTIETHVIENDNNPVWDHRDVMTGFVPGDALEFKVLDKDGKEGTVLGVARLRSGDFYPQGFRGKMPLREGMCSKLRKDAYLEVQIYHLKKLDTSEEDEKEERRMKAWEEEQRLKALNRPSLSVVDNSHLPPTPPTPDGYDGYGLHGGSKRQDPLAGELSEYYGSPSQSQSPTSKWRKPGDQSFWAVSLAVVKLQRWWRHQSFSVIEKSKPVRLPPSAEDDQDVVPTAITGAAPQKRGLRNAERGQSAQSADPAWHARLAGTAKLVQGAVSSSVSRRCSVQLNNMQENGRFVCACRVAAVLAVHATMLDPHGTYPTHSRRQDDGRASKVPHRITRDDPLWPHVRPRFDGDRVFVHDSIVLTIIGGSVVGAVDFETAWRVYSHDLAGLQALTDIIMGIECVNPIVPAVAVVIDYLGFRVICRPQALFIGSRPPELVIGPLAEAATAYSGPGDIPELYRAAQGSQRTELSLLVNTWEEHHQDLRLDLDCIARNLRLQGLPIVLDVTDLPDNVESTALVRIGPDLHFRTPAELLPPEVLTDAGLADPTRRFRREALELLNAPPLPMTHRMSSYMTDNAGDDDLGPQRLQAFSLFAARELPQRFVDRLEQEGNPLDSRGWTELLHSSGVNCRHIGWVAAGASTAAAAALHREALARTAKWIFRHRLRRRVPWAIIAGQSAMDARLDPSEVAAREVINIFNLTLGAGEQSHEFWNVELIPETVRRFGVAPTAIEKPRIFAGALFFCMQHHLKVRFRKTADTKPLFHVGLEEPFTLGDLLPFRSTATATFFPHLRIVQQRIQILQNRMMGMEDEGDPRAAHTKAVELRGFAPEVRIICARGPEWLSAVHTPARHVRDGRWDRAYEALNLRLSMTRAIGDPPAQVGGALQGISVALLKLSRMVTEAGADTDIDFVKGRSLVMDKNRARQAMWAAEAATRMLPNTISGWWAQLAALEAEWLLQRPVEAEIRLQRLNAQWNRFAADQPMLQLKLQDTIARLMGMDGDWAGASSQLKECIELAEYAFGRTHPATISYSARLGDALVRQQAWLPAVHVFRQALALCETAGDQNASARIGYELANALHRSGDVAGAKAHAENVVWSVLPRLHAQSGAGSGQGHSAPPLSRTAGGAFALDSLHLLARIYEDIFLRAVSLSNGAGLSAGDRLEVAQRSISCYEALLRQLPMMMNNGSGGLSREGQVVESILRMKTLTTGHEERIILEDAIESLIVSSSIAQDPDIASMKGVRALQPKVQTRAIAAAALRTSTDDLDGRINVLCEAVARDAALNGLGPAAWFDRILSRLSCREYWGLTELKDPMHQSTLQMLDLCRHFMGDRLRF